MQGTKKLNNDILTSSQSVKELLRKRIFDELKLTYRDVERDAKRFGTKGIFTSTLSRYFNNKYPVYGGLKHANIVWLCLRYGIELKLYCNLIKYNEEECMETLKKFFDITTK